MKKFINKKVAAIGAGLMLVAAALTGCGTDAATVDQNIKTEADKFNIQRTIVATNGITGDVIAYVEGRCSFELSDQRADFLCKVSDKGNTGEFRKYTAKVGDQDSIFIAMEEPVEVNKYHTKFVIRPQAILPEFDIQIGEDKD